MGAVLNRQDLFERIVLSLSDVALGDVPWLASAGLIEEFLEASGSFLIFGDGAALDDVCIFFAQFCMGGERRDDLERMYFETYHAVDERLPRVRLLADSELVTTRSLFTEDELKTSAVYNEAMPLARTRDSLHVRLDGPKGSRIVWAVGDPVEGDGWSGEHVESIRLLLPYIRHFVRVQQTLADAGALESSLTGLLDNVRVGVLQLDRRGRVMAVNDRARDILRRADGLTDRDGLLQAALPAEDTRLQCLLAGALPIPGRVRAGGSMMVSRPHAPQQLIVHVNPVNEARPNSYRASVGALVWSSNRRAATVSTRPGWAPCSNSRRWRARLLQCWRDAGARADDSRDRGGNRAQPEGYPLAPRSYLRQAWHLPASRAGAAGDGALQHSGVRAVTRLRGGRWRASNRNAYA